MHRLAVLLAVAGCDARAADAPPPARWAYAPPPIAWQLGASRGRFGRGEAAQPVTQLGIAGAGPALYLPTPWGIPGDGPARAAVSGLEGDRPAVELVDVDAGRVVWREREACAALIVGVTAKAIVCADAKGTRAVGLDGKPRWRSDATFVAITEDRIVTAAVGEAVILDADTGDELARVKLPAGIAVSTVVASCGDAGRELFAIANDRLVRIAEAKGGPKVTWSQPIGDLRSIDACEGTSVVAAMEHELVAFARATGAITGRVEAVRGFWPSGDRIAISTSTGVARYARDLATPTPTELPMLGELIAKRGTRRLVRASPQTAVLLEGARVLAYVPLAELGAALGDRAVLAASWSGSPHETLHRFALPAPWPRRLRIAATPSVAVPAELRDLPAAAVPATLESAPSMLGRAIAFALDLEDPGALYAVTGAGLARAELGARTWRWQQPAACPRDAKLIAIARGDVICASATEVRGIAKATGAPAWTASLAADALAAAGDVVVIQAADRAVVIDAITGRRLGELASDDGAPARAVPIARGETTWLVTAERGRLVARIPHAGMLPAWSLGVAGTVAAIQASGEGVLVTLDGGDAYRIELATARVIALPGLGLAWQASGELVIGAAIGGPLPAPLPMPPPAPKRVGPPPKPPKPDPEAAPMSVPIAMPAPLGESFELTFYALHGGLRARNDYAITGVLAPRTAGAPLAIVGGGEALIVETQRGDPVARVTLPERTTGVFATIVDGKPVSGALLADPLGFVLF